MSQLTFPVAGPCVWIDYTNWRGVRAVRCIRPAELFWGSTEHHPREQYLLKAWDVDKGGWRIFSMNCISRWSNLAFELPAEPVRPSRSELLSQLDDQGVSAVADKAGCCDVCFDAVECISNLQCRANLSTLTKVAPDPA